MQSEIKVEAATITIANAESLDLTVLLKTHRRKAILKLQMLAALRCAKHSAIAPLIASVKHGPLPSIYFLVMLSIS